MSEPVQNRHRDKAVDAWRFYKDGAKPGHVMALIAASLAAAEAEGVRRERAEIDRLRAELAAARAVLRSVEWEGDRSAWDGSDLRCPSCGGCHAAGHHDGCALAAALAVPTGDPHA